MSPEQAAGDSGDAKPAFDQYALGVTLSELLAGRTPFSGPSKIKLFHTVNTPPPPLSLIPGVQAGLLKILLPGGGEIRTATASSAAKDGKRETFVVFRPGRRDAPLQNA